MKYIVLSIIVFGLSFFGFTKPIQSMFDKLTTPAQLHLKLQAREIKQLGSFFNDIQRLKADYEKLYKENFALTTENSRLRLRAGENVLLRKQLKVATSNKNLSSSSYVLAQVYVNHQDPSGASIVIDKGTQDKVEVGSGVVIENVLVGVVVNAGHTNSIVALPTSPLLKVAAYVLPAKASPLPKAEGIVSGQFGTAIRLSRLLPGDNVRVGDLVLTKGISQSFPADLLIGRVARLEGDSADALRNAFIEPSVNLSQIEKVFVLIN